MARKARQFKGNPHEDGVLLFEDKEWQLYLKNKGGSDVWRNLKLAAIGRADHKGNYHLAYNLEEKRFARMHDMRILAKQRPEMEQWVVEALNSKRARTLVKR